MHWWYLQDVGYHTNTPEEKQGDRKKKNIVVHSDCSESYKTYIYLTADVLQNYDFKQRMHTMLIVEQTEFLFTHHMSASRPKGS